MVSSTGKRLQCSHRPSKTSAGCNKVDTSLRVIPKCVDILSKTLPKASMKRLFTMNPSRMNLAMPQTMPHPLDLPHFVVLVLVFIVSLRSDFPLLADATTAPLAMLLSSLPKSRRRPDNRAIAVSMLEPFLLLFHTPQRDSNLFWIKTIL